MGPREGIDVVFSDPAGALIAHVKTDADGAASAAVGTGATVTIAAIGDGTRALTTITGVGDGELVAVPVPWGPRAAPTRALIATVTAGPTGTDTYQLTAGCAYASLTAPGPAALAIPEPCVTAGHVTVLALATTAGAVVGYSTIDASVDAGTVALPAWRTDLTALDVAVAAP